MYLNKRKIFLCCVLLGFGLVLISSPTCFAYLYEFSPEEMTTAAGLMSPFFNNLMQNQEYQKQLQVKKTIPRNLVKRLQDMRLYLFQLHSYLAGLHERIKRNALDIKIIEDAAQNIGKSVKGVDDEFDEFCRRSLPREIKNQYAGDIDAINDHLDRSTRITSGDLMRNLERSIGRNEHPGQYGQLFDGLLQKLSSLDNSILMFMKKWEQK